MLLSRRNRGRVFHKAECDCCNKHLFIDPKSYRRMTKHVEKRAWKKEVGI